VVDALRFGAFAGLVSKAVWFVFGLVTTGLALSGVVIFWKRSARLSEGQARPAVRRAWFVVRPWGGAMGWFKPFNIAVLALALAASVMTLRFYSATADERAANFAAQQTGPWSLGAIMIAGLGDTSDPVRPGARAMVVVRFCPECWSDIKRVWVNIGRQPLHDKGRRVSGQPGFAYASLRLPQKLDPDIRLWLVAEGWDGRQYKTSWPLVR
jgi:hypothetical protein